ncbi:unnamed protein product [Candida verbasci]|uniref:Inactive metallocarboxypeptidase ECM14 n=1 Tax=Candida verbasci TaxID=1227364 RepID=A0A9W4XAN6_9ASCO|nr:unnamed protein product [Candida verbasci]
MKFIGLLFIIPFALSFQIPFSLKDILSDSHGHVQHFSKLNPNDYPIDLLQYQNDLVIRINYSNNKNLYNFLKTQSSFSNQSFITFKKWGNSNIQKTLDIQIDEENLIRLIERYPTIDYKIIIDDLSQKIYETYPRLQNSAEVFNAGDIHAATELFFKEYRSYETINSWLDLLESSYPQVLKIEEIGQTYEHRKYKVVHFAAPNDNGDINHQERKTIVITGGVHAREWISVSSVLYTIYQLLNFYVDNPNSKILKNLDFLFIPISNPDGYAYTWSTDRLWRKNRQETTVPKCFGIDIDHSYDYHWTKSSDWACGDEYSGEVPFEAFESKIWEHYLNNTNNAKNHKIYGYIDLHSYSQEILYPYAYSCDQQPRDEENLVELAWGIAKAIRLQSGTNYNVEPACIDKDADLLPDLGSGTSLDYMYHNRAYWAYQLKLRDSGSHGFLLPSKYIEPVGLEVFAALKYFCTFILNDD